MRALAIVAFAAVTACAGQQAVEFRPLPNAPGPFSEAVRVGNMLYLSGAIGTDSSGKVVAGGIGPETRQTMENISATLARSSLTMANVVKCTVMLADIKEWPAMNEVYRTFFPGSKPARSAFAGTGLALNARVEIECLAAIP
jgi:reactive intermediate/imine deaminase